jgi:hypothetical protein
MADNGYTPNLYATGDVNPCRFITQNGSNTAAQCGAGGVVCGVSKEWTRMPTISGAVSYSETRIAISGESIPYWGFGAEAVIEVGGTVAGGAYLKSDANGRAVTATTGDYAYARAIQGTSAGVGTKITILILNSAGVVA